MAGIPTIKNKWAVYDIAIPTLGCLPHPFGDAGFGHHPQYVMRSPQKIGVNMERSLDAAKVN